jgi:hypothetical protein
VLVFKLSRGGFGLDLFPSSFVELLLASGELGGVKGSTLCVIFVLFSSQFGTWIDRGFSVN